MPLKKEELLTDEQKKGFDDKYGEEQWARVAKRNRRDPSAVDFEIAFRAPTPVEYQLFKSRAFDKATQTKAQETLVKQCLLHPSREKLDELLTRWPGMMESDGVTNAVREMTGMVGDEQEK